MSEEETSNGDVTKSFVIMMPADTAATFNSLVEMHPGLKQDRVVARALCLYHTLFQCYLEKKTCEHINEMLEVLNKIDGLELKQ